jgi:hypothetical protein
MKYRWFILFLAATFFFGCTKESFVESEEDWRDDLTASLAKAKRTTTIQKSAYNEVFTIPCANNNRGEQVSLVGTSELMTQTLTFGAITSVTMTYNIKNAKGVGSDTKSDYRGGGGFSATFITSSKDLRYSFTYEESITIRAPGKGNNYLYKLSASQLIGPRGNVIKEYKVKQSTDCK